MPGLRTRVTVSTAIDAPASDVWRALVDLGGYPEWNPYFVSATGDVVEGGMVTLRAVLAGKRPARSRCRVVTVQTDRRLRWRSRLLLPGLLDADHTFDLVAATPQRTELRQEEIFQGLLVPVAPRDDIDRACTAMAQALRARVEGWPSRR